VVYKCLIHDSHLACVLEKFCGKLSLGMLDKPILVITFCVNFHQKALNKGGQGGGFMNCECEIL